MGVAAEEAVVALEASAQRPTVERAGRSGLIGIGSDVGSPVTDIYPSPFAFTGLIDGVVYDVSGESIVDHEAEIRAAIARQ